MKKRYKLKRKYKIASALLALVLCVAFLFTGGLNTVKTIFNSVVDYYGAGDEPAHSKNIDDNGDGTYKLGLSVTGDADTEVETAANVNVLIVYDTSSSMTSNNVTTNPNRNRADYSEDVVHDFIEGLRGYQNTSDPSNIQVAVVTFGTRATGDAYPAQSWTSDLTGGSNGANRFFDDGVDGNLNSSYSGHNGTNWEAALQRAQTFLNNADSDPTFVILVTDGACTASGNGNNAINPAGTHPWTDFQPFYNAARDEARAINTRANTTLFGIYAYGREADLLDDLIYYGQNGSDRPGMNGGTVDTPNYFSATDTAALNSAIESIFQTIVNALGISSVSISDGTTNQVTTSTGEISELLDVDEDSYQYWLSIPVVNNQFQRVNLVTGNTDTYTVTDHGDGTCTVTWGTNSVDVDGKVSGGQFEYEWTEANALYNYDPPEAKLVDGSVDWNLSPVGTLLDGVKYTVTFDVYPSQETYDLIADLKNGESALARQALYEAQDANIREYLKNTNDQYDNYTLATNTTATLTYTDTRTDDGTQTTEFTNPPAIATEASEIEVVKKWENELDGRTSQPVTMKLKRAGEEIDELTLSTDNDWTDSKYISTGLLKTVKDGDEIVDIRVLDEGHDYTLTEPEKLAYYWELDIETVHPMIIDGELTTLVEVTGKDIPSEMGDANYYTEGGKEFYRIGDEIYYAKYHGDKATLKAINNRKSNLNVKKIVDGDSLDGETFKFTFNIDNVGDTQVWFSVEDENGSRVMNLSTSATAEVNDDGDKTGYYYFNNNYEGDSIYVELEKDWNLRFINLGTGSKYKVEEVIDSIYELTDVEATTIITSVKELPVGAVSIGNNQYRYGEAGAADTIIYTEKEDEEGEKYYEFEYTPTVNGKVTTGEVVAPNTSYNVEYTNKYPATNLEVEKVWHDGEPEEGTTVTFTLYQNGEPTDKTLTLPQDGKWSGAFKDLDLRDDDGNLYEYSAVETEVEGYQAFYEGSAKALVSAKNVPEGTETINVDVLADDEVVATVSLNKDGEWVGTSDEFDFLNKDGTLKTIDIESDVEEADVSFILTDREITVTNYENIDITVTKQWEDNNNQDGKRTNVDITLYADDEEVDSHTFNTQTTNSYTFENLDKYRLDEDGELVDIVYSVDEVEVPEGYEKDVSGSQEAGFTVTNTHEPEVTSSTVVKVWDDDENNDGKRPEQIVVSFSGDNTDHVLNDDNEWTITISDLPKYEDGEEIEYTWSEVEVPEGYTLTGNETEGTVTTLTNSHEAEETEATVIKVWDDDEDNDGKRPESLEVQLKDGNDVVSTETLSEGNGWTVTVDGLPKYRDKEEIEYTWSEENVPTGYTLTGNEREGTVTTLTNSHENEKTTSTVLKVWNDNDDNDGKRPEQIVVSFSGDNSDHVLNDANEWTITISDLPKYEDGDEIEYTWSEVEVPEGYTLSTSVSGTKTTLTNSHDAETVSSKVTKVWDDDSDRDGKRQTELEVTLKGDNEVVASDTLTETNNWTTTVDGLPKYKDKTEIEYVWSEGELEEGYTMASSTTDPDDDTNTIITNHYDPERTRVCIKKVWDDDEDRDGKRPLSLTVTLSNGQFVTLNAENDWYAEIDDLFKYENHGSLINYTWSEEDVEGYELTGNTTEEELTTLTNTYNIETTSATVNKVWDDDDDNDGKRPETITVKLTADDPSFEDVTKTLSEDNEWTATVTGLPKYMNNGEDEVTYTWSEVSVPDGYTLEEPVVSGTTTTLTNKHVPEKTEVPVKKIWDETANTFGFDSPESVKVNLLANGTKVRDVVLSANNEWKHVFEDLPKYDNKEEITYLVEEEEVPDYDFSLEGNATDGFEITNTYNPTLIPVKVTKTWNDNFDQDGKRDGTITFILTGKVGESVVYTSPETPITGSINDEKWYYTFEDLPEKYHGETITYSVTEKLPNGSVYTGENVSDVEIMNSYDPQTVSFNLTKIWDDDDDNDRIRPESITIHLLADGVELETAVITADDNWSWSRSGLPKYRDHGVAIKYTITEDVVEGYKDPVISYTEGEEEINSTLTNPHENEKTSIEVQKVWVDDNNKYKIRPKTITVQIFANGKLVRTIEITAADNWRKVISDLDKYLQGEEITYTIIELPVDGYGTTIDGYTITNTILPIGKTEITPPNTKVGDTDTKSNLLLLIILLVTSVISAVTTTVKN